MTASPESLKNGALAEKIAYSFAIAIEAIGQNKTRALLTSLGIIFGVCSVIAMLAIGRGAQVEILEQIRLLGADNVIITPIIEQKEGGVSEDVSAKEEKKPFSPGLTLADARSVAAVIPGVKSVSPEIIAETVAIRAGIRRSTKLVGVDAPFFEGPDFELSEGALFSPEHMAASAPVCIIGYRVKSRFFPKEEALGRQIKVGQLWLTVVGVLKERHLAADQLEHLGLRDYNFDIYVPINTLLLRFENRAQLTERDLRTAEMNRQRGVKSEEMVHQLDRLTVRAERSELVRPIAEVAARLLERRHNRVVDFQVTIPEVLLQQQQRTQRIFNIVLAAIASISLIVGGIGIMNIMLASVLERTKEIGIRRSLGATRHDIAYQFLIEAVAISFTGGAIGVLLGIGISVGIEMFTGIVTIVSVKSVLLAFLVSVSVGLIFGLLPARRAAEYDPVDALRYE